MILMWIVTILAVILSINYYLVRRNLQYSWQFPGPRAFPIIGCLYLYINKKPEDIASFVLDLTKEYGSLFRVWVGRRLALFSSGVKDIEFVLSSHKILKKNNLYAMLERWLGSGLLLSTDKKWYDKRKIITPAFHFKILEQFVDIFDAQSEIFVQELEKHADGKLFNIYPFITRLTLDIICETSMGTQIKAQTNMESEYVKAVKELSYILTNRMVKVWQRIDFVYYLTSGYKKEKEAIKTMHKFTTEIIQKRRQMLLETGATSLEPTADDVGSKRKQVFLDVLLQSTIEGKPLTDFEIQEEVDTFMFEGHDTTSSAIVFTTFLLAKHPEIQEKVYEEIKEVIGSDPKKPVTYRNLQDLKYLELCIKESLRLYPPVPIIGRRFTEKIELNGKIVPEETNFNIGIFVIHRDPKYFPEPDKFIPERFSTENSMETSYPFAYIPFSAGPRNCIGQKFAMLEMKSTISKLLRDYELIEADPDPKLIIQLVLKPDKGCVLVGIKKRN